MTHELEEIGKIVAAIVTIFGIAKILPKLKKIAIFFKNYFLAPLRISKIINELQPNGGSSLRDSINRIENAQTVLSQKLAYSIDRNGCGAFYTSADGALIDVSIGYCRLVGKSDSESLGKGWVYNIAIKDRSRVVQDWKDAIDNGAMFSCRYFLINSAEEEILVICHAYPVKDSKGIINGFFGIIEPVGEDI